MYRLEFKGINNYDSVCGVEVHGKVIVVTELFDNHGTSVTNAWPALADKILSEYDFPPENVIWIEHYRSSRLRPATWDRVHLDLVDGSFIMSKDKHPWESLTEKQVHELLNSDTE